MKNKNKNKKRGGEARNSSFSNQGVHINNLSFWFVCPFITLNTRENKIKLFL